MAYTTNAGKPQPASGFASKSANCIVIATPLRMRDVLHAIWHGLSAFGGVMKTAALAFAKFWGDVFRAMHGHVLDEASTHGTYSLHS